MYFWSFYTSYVLSDQYVLIYVHSIHAYIPIKQLIIYYFIS